jgi:hypothetical protein
MPLRFTHWEQTVEEGVEIVVDNQLQVQGRFAHWTDRAYIPLVVPRNLPGESIGIYPLFDIVQCCSLPRLSIIELLDEADLLCFRTARATLSRLITIERANEPQAEPEPEFRNLRVAFTLHFLQ